MANIVALEWPWAGVVHMAGSIGTEADAALANCTCETEGLPSPSSSSGRFRLSHLLRSSSVSTTSPHRGNIPGSDPSSLSSSLVTSSSSIVEILRYLSLPNRLKVPRVTACHPFLPPDPRGGSVCNATNATPWPTMLHNDASAKSSGTSRDRGCPPFAIFLQLLLEQQPITHE